MEIKKVKINNRMYDVTSVENYVQHKNLYDTQYTSLEVDNMVLPIIGKLDGRVGICVGSMVSFYNPPEPGSEKEYLVDNVIDFSKATNMAELIQAQEHVKSLENEIIVNSENIFEPRIDDNDFPEMKALKEAVIAKQVDINAYAPRFGTNFANDKRAFNANKISLDKIKRIANVLDMKCTLTIEDKSSNVPNPIGRVITVEITGGGYNDNDDDE